MIERASAEDHGEPPVLEDRAGSRFVVQQDDSVAELVYKIDGDRIVLEHTGVPESMGGRGIGGLLVQAAVNKAAEDRLTVVPWCPFTRRWLRDHPDSAATVTIDWKSRPPL